ncbi:hydrogenase [Geothrix limicola]|uniref:Hydrogenase n=1 Tax=Geothrix limicola TaxID=2927978 RepID=A0ABQ5QK57_9BACT|nr:proton-conducting transporter membrane subunit [Geothrix limicola]GLH74399.1 hydrogenase [Geothrix limicola]
MSLYLAAILLAALSGVPGLFLKRRGGEVAAGALTAAALLGIGAALRVLLGAAASGFPGTSVATLSLPSLPLGSPGLLGLDPIAAWFLIPVLLLSACGAWYGTRYWEDPHGHPGRVRFVFGLLVACLALLVSAAHAWVFLMAWEGMAVAAFFLVITEDRLLETRRAAWIYLVSTHSGTLILLGAFALLAGAMGHWNLGPLPRGFAASPAGTTVFLLFLLGFGFKAGAMPLHIWLPLAHAAAPSHVSSLMSGVLIKMGILGLVRLVAWVPDPPLWWGVTLLVLGALSGILGVAFALGQHDLKRLLAYHSIENIGIILLGLGLGLVGKSTGHPVVAALGFAGALLHVLNHGLFKGLLFLAAGSVVHATGTRNLEQMGGLGKAMPWTSAAFLTGSWAICGLPPLNGFVSEWFIYLGAFRAMALSRWPWSVGVLASLALIGALALACFAKAHGAAFLGTARSEAAQRAHESPRAMLLPMGVLAATCVFIGVFPVAMAPLLDRVVAGLGEGMPPLAAMAKLPILTGLALALLALALALGRWLKGQQGAAANLPTWDCGYGETAPRAQYTASSLADSLVTGARFVLLPVTHRARVRGLFPKGTRFESHVPDPVLDRALDPAFRLGAKGLALLHLFQTGQMASYLLYVLLTLLFLLIWMVV